MKNDNKKSKHDEIDKITEKLLQELSNSSVIKHISEEETKKMILMKEGQKDIESLPPLLSEYLKNYIIVAHDLLGNEVIMSYATSKNDINAVQKLFYDTFIKMIAPHRS
jgi:hypothetical protein